jgi:hypothetical protein
MAAKTCRVSCQDLTGVLHSVEVTAESLYEAVARGLSTLKASDWVEEIGDGLTPITVEILETTPVKHQVLMKDFRRWLAENGNTPAGISVRQKAREILGETPELSGREKKRRWAPERNR